MDPLDSVDLEIVCPCGYENFERVVVRRSPHSPIVTDFAACIGCRTVYFVPMPRGPDITGGPDVARKWRLGDAIGGPPGSRQPEPSDTADALKRDAAVAAKDYVKPGRSGRLKPGGR